MRALILAAGLGTRLRPLTEDTPKALVPVGGNPMLHYTLKHLRKTGFLKARINLHHHGEQIIGFLLDVKSEYGIDIIFQDEREKLLGSGGAISLASEWLFENDEYALIWNPDGILFPDIKEMEHRFLEQRKLGVEAMLNVFPHPDVGSRYNPVCVQGDRVIAFGDTEEEHEKMHFAGGYILTKEAVEMLPPPGEESCVVKKVWFPLVKERKMAVYRYSGPYQDLGTPEDIEIGNFRFESGEFESYL